ncbi:hypothetical protein [Actinokineospora sp.]|uniref:hypothetical protein n=1 Tax=Actinokineospora sp. TaxID=1872133 RepID=UPI00403770D4
MDQAKRETTALVRRVVSRALFVLGGTVATTAAAWAISSATAVADTTADLQHNLRSAVEALPVLDAPALADGKALVIGVTDSLGRIIGEPMDPDFGAHAQESVEEFGRQIAEHLTPKPLSVERIDTVVESLTELSPAPVAPPAAEAPVTVVTLADKVRPGAVDEIAVAGAKERANADGMNRRGSPVPADEAPGLPGGPGPLAPLSVPAPAAPGHTGTGSVDAPVLGLLSAVPAGTDLTATDALRSAQVLVPATVAAQPGVTPD